MKLPPTFPKKATLAAAAAALMALAVPTGCNKGANPAAHPSSKSAGAGDAGANTAAGARVNLDAEFVSVFDDSPPPGNKGRDPFNPNSSYRDPQLPRTVTPGSAAGPVDPQLKLFGVAGSPKRWLANINNHIFDLKEEATISVAGGKVKLQVVEIGSNYADIVIEGSAVTKRLTLSPEKQQPRTP
jgi:hypothetical protein